MLSDAIAVLAITVAVLVIVVIADALRDRREARNRLPPAPPPQRPAVRGFRHDPPPGDKPPARDQQFR